MNRFRRTQITLIALALAIFASGATALLAQGGPGPGPRGFGPGARAGRGFDAGFALGQLNLSDAQKQQVRDIMQRYRQQSQPTMERLQQAIAAERAAINQVPVNEAAVRQAAAALAAIQADVAVDQARLHADVWNILTPDQQAKAKELEQQAQARAQERRQRAPRQPKQPV